MRLTHPALGTHPNAKIFIPPCDVCVAPHAPLLSCVPWTAAHADDARDACGVRGGGGGTRGGRRGGPRAPPDNRLRSQSAAAVEARSPARAHPTRRVRSPSKERVEDTWIGDSWCRGQGGSISHVCFPLCPCVSYVCAHIFPVCRLLYVWLRTGRKKRTSRRSPSIGSASSYVSTTIQPEHLETSLWISKHYIYIVCLQI